MSTAVRRAGSVKMVAAVLVAILASVCLGDIAQATMAGSENHDCSGRVCDEQTACSATTPAPALSASHAAPLGTLPVLDARITLEPAAVVVVFPRSEIPPDRQVVPLVPRSPPVTS